MARFRRAPRAVPINQECVRLRREAVSLRNWWERELDRWRTLWKEHTYYRPEFDEDGVGSIDTTAPTMLGKDIYDGGGKDETLDELDALINEYEAAAATDDPSRQCTNIRADNENLYRRMEFFKDYDTAVESAFPDDGSAQDKAGLRKVQRRQTESDAVTTDKRGDEVNVYHVDGTTSRHYWRYGTRPNVLHERPAHLGARQGGKARRKSRRSLRRTSKSSLRRTAKRGRRVRRPSRRKRKTVRRRRRTSKVSRRRR